MKDLYGNSGIRYKTTSSPGRFSLALGAPPKPGNEVGYKINTRWHVQSTKKKVHTESKNKPLSEFFYLLKIPASIEDYSK